MSEAEPSEIELLRRAADARVSHVHTSIPGEVLSYDPALQTCKVRISVKDFVPSDDDGFLLEDPPDLMNVPILWPGGGGFQMHWALQAGDSVLVVFSERATSMWRLSGKQSDPGDYRRHGMNGVFAIPNIRPITKPVTNLLPGAVVCSLPAGGIIFGNALAAQFLARADLVTTALNQILSWANSHVHTGVTTGGGASGPPGTPLAAMPPVASTKVKAE